IKGEIPAGTIICPKYRVHDCAAGLESRLCCHSGYRQQWNLPGPTSCSPGKHYSLVRGTSVGIVLAQDFLFLPGMTVMTVCARKFFSTICLTDHTSRR